MIIKPFNGVFFMVLIIIAAIIVGLTFFLKNKSEKAKRNVILGLAMFNMVFWVIYKIWLSQGSPELDATGFVFNIYRELPLHVCNLSLIIIIIALLLKNDFLYSYCFYVSVIGAIMAIVAPALGFSGNSIFLKTNLGYYGTHGLIIINGVLLVTLGFYKPCYKGLIKSLASLLLFALIAHGVNYFFYFVFHQETDYFFTMHNSVNSFLDIFYNLVPVRFIYLLIPFVIFSIQLFLLTIPFEIYYKKKAK